MATYLLQRTADQVSIGYSNSIYVNFTELRRNKPLNKKNNNKLTKKKKKKKGILRSSNYKLDTNWHCSSSWGAVQGWYISA